MELDIPGALRDLSKVVNRIAELREWQRLELAQLRPGCSIGLLSRDFEQQEIDTLCGSFMLLDLSIHEALDRADLNCASNQKKSWQRRLRELEQGVALVP